MPISMGCTKIKKPMKNPIKCQILANLEASTTHVAVLNAEKDVTE
jgi:hypothetical protein